MDFIVLLLGILFGVLIGIRGMVYYQSYLSKQVIKKTEALFLSVKDNLVFKQRIHNFVHFSSGEYGVVFIIDKNEIAIFENECCIAISSTINKKLNDELINMIKEKFDKDINDVEDITGYKVSKEYLKSIQTEKSDIDMIQEQNETKFTLDDILEKISTSGIKSLTEKEIEFLKKW